MEEAAVEGTNILVSIIIWIIVGGIAGWLASSIVKGGGMGLVGNVVLGIVGAIVAGFLLPAIGIGLMSDTDNTGEQVHAWYGDIQFLPRPDAPHQHPSMPMVAR